MKKLLTILLGLLFTAMLASLVFIHARPAFAKDKSNAQLHERAIELRPDDVTTMVGVLGELAGTATAKNAAANLVSLQSTVTWRVQSPKEEDYSVSMIISCATSEEIEVRCGASVLSAHSMPKTWSDRPDYWRQEIPGLLHLKAGENQIIFHLLNANGEPGKANSGRRHPGAGVAKGFSVWSIELGTPAARQAQQARAKAIRADPSWMIEGKYGLFVHWTPLGFAFKEDQQRWKWHQKAVDMFDVKVFADAVERTGAKWMIFTVTHGKFYWPGPSQAIDKVLPGRTTKRDLIGEIITELDRRGIRTLFYLHNCVSGKEDPEWSKAVRAQDADTTKFGDNIEAILRESSLRYGKKLSGYGYIDCAFENDYPLDPPWERWTRAIKAGNPTAVVGFSSQFGPTVTPFSELAVTDGGEKLTGPNREVIGPGRQLGDVTPAWWLAMDAWRVSTPMNGKIGKGPTAREAQYIAFFKRMAAEKTPVTINLCITADVTDKHPIFNEKCMAVMEEVRKAIRGK